MLSRHQPQGLTNQRVSGFNNLTLRLMLSPQAWLMNLRAGTTAQSSARRGLALAPYKPRLLMHVREFELMARPDLALAPYVRDERYATELLARRGLILASYEPGCTLQSLRPLRAGHAAERAACRGAKMRPRRCTLRTKKTRSN